jgi:orotate phosphoribosyltransferase
MNENEVLDCFRCSGALLEGHFELRSGLHSPHYFQCALVLRDPEVAERMGRALAEQIHKHLGQDPADAVIAPALGGLIVGHEVGRALRRPFLFAEKENQVLVLRRGFSIEAGRRYVVAEDVITRGGRVYETMAIVRKGGGVVTAVAVLVDRSAGQAPLDVPLFRLLTLAPVTYPPDSCPLCRQGIPISHPGS